MHAKPGVGFASEQESVGHRTVDRSVYMFGTLTLPSQDEAGFRNP